MKSILLGLGSMFFSFFLQAAHPCLSFKFLKTDSGTQSCSSFGKDRHEKDSSLSVLSISPRENASRFFSKLFIRFVGKRSQEPGPGDKLAEISWWVGLVAFACAIYPWFTLLAALPLGLAAIILAAQAKRAGSKKRNGKGFGILAVAGFIIWVALSLVLLSSYGVVY